MFAVNARKERCVCFPLDSCPYRGLVLEAEDTQVLPRPDLDDAWWRPGLWRGSTLDGGETCPPMLMINAGREALYRLHDTTIYYRINRLYSALLCSLIEH